MATGLSGLGIDCSADDILHLDPPLDQTCGSYLSAPGLKVYNPADKADCEVCTYTTSDSLLAYFNIFFEDRWWQWGVTVAYNAANIAITLLFYWLFRVRKGQDRTSG